tara:strand:+ start:801 stop:977 length:177 start_codon:yes stop_codon:yes gene_type:complete
MQPLQNFSTAHLNAVNETFTQYFFHVDYYFVMLMAAAIFAITYAIYRFYLRADQVELF